MSPSTSSNVLVYIGVIVVVAVVVLLAIKYFGIKRIFLTLSISYLIQIPIIVGVLYWLTNTIEKTGLVSSRFTVYIILLILLILIFQAENIIPAKSGLKTITTRIRNYLSTMIVLSGFLCWYISKINPLLGGFEAWLTSLDIILAHVVVTLPMLQWLNYMIYRILRINELIWVSLSRKISPDDFGTVYYIARYILNPIISIGISLWVIWLLLIKTPDLQSLLFGKYNQYLGLEISTSYRFSALFEQLKIFFGNQTIATIFGFLAFAISATLSFSSLLSSVKNIKSEFKKEKESDGVGYNI